MEDETGNFTIALTVNKDDNGHVYYKQDGQRFDINCTIKKNVDTSYKFTVTLRPPHVLDSVSVRGSAVYLNEDRRTDRSATYGFEWSSVGVPTTKSNLRDILPITLMIHGLGSLTLMLQVKFYKENDTNHATWGTALHHIDFECKYSEHKSFIEIIREVYR